MSSSLAVSRRLRFYSSHWSVVLRPFFRRLRCDLARPACPSLGTQGAQRSGSHERHLRRGQAVESSHEMPPKRQCPLRGRPNTMLSISILAASFFLSISSLVLSLSLSLSLSLTHSLSHSLSPSLSLSLSFLLPVFSLSLPLSSLPLPPRRSRSTPCDHAGLAFHAITRASSNTVSLQEAKDVVPVFRRVRQSAIVSSLRRTV